MEFLFYLALIPALGTLAQWVAWRTQLPGILLLLFSGMVLGLFAQPDAVIAELIGGRETAVSEILFPLVSLAVAVIMFEGGLSLRLSDLRESGKAALRLCTVGAALTFAGAGFAAWWLLDFDPSTAALLGAILVVTGPTVIGPLLRQVRPSKRVSNTLKWEGIVIDPIGAVLAVLVFEQLADSGNAAGFAPAAVMLLRTAMVGTVTGLVGGFVISTALRRYLIPDHLHGVAALTVGLLLFAVANHYAHESGLITVTVMGIWLINQTDLDVEHIVEFKENLRTLLLGGLFIVLGSRVDLQQCREVLWPSLLFLLVLVLAVRPISVFISLIGTSLNFREKAFIASLAPRGIVAAAVSSVFALELESVGQTSANQLSTVVFIVIVGTVAIYGLLAAPVARLLHLADQRSDGLLIIGADSWVRDLAKAIVSANVPVKIVDTNFAKVSLAKQAGLDAVCINMLNEHAREELELAGIGKLLAMTPNDEVNSLIVRECRAMFERKNGFQLMFDPGKLKSRRGVTKNLMGRALFHEGATYTSFRERHDLGSSFKVTPLSEEFTYAAFAKKYQDNFELLAVISEDGKLTLETPEKPLQPNPGDRILTLVGSIVIPDEHPVGV